MRVYIKDFKTLPKTPGLYRTNIGKLLYDWSGWYMLDNNKRLYYKDIKWWVK